MGRRRLLKEYSGSCDPRLPGVGAPPLCAVRSGASNRFRVCTLLATASIAACQTSATGLELPHQLVDGITYRVTGFTIAESEE